MTAARRRAIALRVRAGRWSVLQAALAATAAYSIAELALGHEQPFFAPVAAVVAISVSIGERGRRAAEIVAGVAIGLVIADLVALALGTGPLRMGLVVALAMVAALAAGGGMLLTNQAAISALLVVTLQPADAAFDASRLLDAAVGAAVAFAINALLPHDPRRYVAAAAHGFYRELAGALDAIATALGRGDPAGVERALGDLGALESKAGELRAALGAASELGSGGPLWRRRHDLGPERRAAERSDLIVADARTLARGAANAVRRGSPAPAESARAIRGLSEAAALLAAAALDSGTDREEIRRRALGAAATAMRAVERRPTLATGMVAGQVRMTAVDLLASSGLAHGDAIAALERTAGRAAELPLAPAGERAVRAG